MFPYLPISPFPMMMPFLLFSSMMSIYLNNHMILSMSLLLMSIMSFPYNFNNLNNLSYYNSLMNLSFMMFMLTSNILILSNILIFMSLQIISFLSIKLYILSITLFNNSFIQSINLNIFIFSSILFNSMSNNIILNIHTFSYNSMHMFSISNIIKYILIYILLITSYTFTTRNNSNL